MEIASSKDVGQLSFDYIIFKSSFYISSLWPFLLHLMLFLYANTHHVHSLQFSSLNFLNIKSYNSVPHMLWEVFRFNSEIGMFEDNNICPYPFPWGYSYRCCDSGTLLFRGCLLIWDLQKLPCFSSNKIYTRTALAIL